MLFRTVSNKHFEHTLTHVYVTLVCSEGSTTCKCGTTKHMRSVNRPKNHCLIDLEGLYCVYITHSHVLRVSNTHTYTLPAGHITNSFRVVSVLKFADLFSRQIFGLTAGAMYDLGTCVERFVWLLTCICIYCTHTHPLLRTCFTVSVLLFDLVDDTDFDKITNIPEEHCYDIKGILSVHLQKNSAPWITITAYRCLVCYLKKDCPECGYDTAEVSPRPGVSTEAVAALMEMNSETQSDKGDRIEANGEQVGTTENEKGK